MARMTIGDKSVATAALAELLLPDSMDPSEAWSVAEALVRAAEKAQYQASTKRLVITFDLSGPAVDEDEPVVPAEPDDQDARPLRTGLE